LTDGWRVLAADRLSVDLELAAGRACLRGRDRNRRPKGEEGQAGTRD
jgi:hypothetical protein